MIFGLTMIADHCSLQSINSYSGTVPLINCDLTVICSIYS